MLVKRYRNFNQYLTVSSCATIFKIKHCHAENHVIIKCKHQSVGNIITPYSTSCYNKVITTIPTYCFRLQLNQKQVYGAQTQHKVIGLRVLLNIIFFWKYSVYPWENHLHLNNTIYVPRRDQLSLDQLETRTVKSCSSNCDCNSPVAIVIAGRDILPAPTLKTDYEIEQVTLGEKPT